MAPFVRSRSQRAAAAVVLASSAAIGFVPLFGGPGYEQSLASGLVLPSAAAIATSLDVSIAPAPDPLAQAGRGLASGAALAVIALLAAMLHAARLGACDLPQGILFFALTAGMGSLLGGAWGAVVGELARGRRRRRATCVALSIAAPLAGIGVSVVRFYATPMIFAYDPFFGYFSGALYDTVIDVRAELWTYRAATAATVLGVCLLAAALRRRPDATLGWRGFEVGRSDRYAVASGATAQGDRLEGDFAAAGAPSARARTVACVAGAAAAWLVTIGIAASGPALGHWQTSTTIAHALGAHAAGPRCDLFFPDSLLPDEAALAVRDCEQELAADERRLGAHVDGRVAEFMFADAEQKRRLMGAADTSIAKPWRREVYVQVEGYPHPLLGHELAHVVAGSFAPGPLHVGGGLWPNPGLIEGVAVAASPDDNDLTDRQWAKAMLELGILPPVKAIFSLGFLQQNAAKSYTVAGAFVAWVSERWGVRAVRDWYGGQPVDRVTGLGWIALDEQFRASLSAVPMPAQAFAYARARFARPSVWQRRCPHVVDALVGAAERCRGEHRYARALALYDAALDEDGGDWRARLERAIVDLRDGSRQRGRDEVARIASDARAPKTWRDRAIEALADDDLVQGEIAVATTTYRGLAAETLDEDMGRTLEVKALASADPAGRRAVLDALIGERGGQPEGWTAGASLATWAAANREPLSAYMLGKNYALHEDWARAAAWLDRAIEAGPAPTVRIGRELLRMRAVSACAENDATALGRVREAVARADSPFESDAQGRLEWLNRLIGRCAASGGGG